MKKILKILKYTGIIISVLIILFIILLAFSGNGEDSYNGGTNPLTKEWCNYGYNQETEQCCGDDDYSCEMRDRGATAECNDSSYSFSLNNKGTCSRHDGVSVWY